MHQNQRKKRVTQSKASVSEAGTIVPMRHPQEVTEEADGFRLLIESVKDQAIFMLDTQGRITTWNPGAERIKGYSASEIVGKHFSIFYPTAAVDAGTCEKELDVAASKGRFEDEGWRLRKDGSRFWANVVITALRNRAGRLVGFGKVTQDLTQRVRAEEERLQLARSEAAERSKDEFLAVVGHELRNPLAPMVTALHLLQLRGGRNCEKEIAIFDRQLRHMMRLVDDLLDLSRAMRDKVQLSAKAIEIGEVLANAIDISSPLIEGKRHRLRLDVAATGLVVEADPERMAQVFGNLLNNAAKYTNAGGEIGVHAQVRGDKIEVTIQDSGIGITPELMPRLFDLFVQGAQGIERHLGGLGIGLAIARRLVNQHGGEITAESDGPGRGSRFTVRLLRAKSLDAKAPMLAPPPPKQPSVRKRVLLVDDSQDVCETMAILLAELGHETRFALDGLQALRIAPEFRPDIVFVDIGLPGMDGFEVARQMRRIPVCAAITIVALSGYARETDRQQSLQAGFSGHLAKPVDLECVERVVARGSAAFTDA